MIRLLFFVCFVLFLNVLPFIPCISIMLTRLFFHYISNAGMIPDFQNTSTAHLIWSIVLLQHEHALPLIHYAFALFKPELVKPWNKVTGTRSIFVVVVVVVKVAPGSQDFIWNESNFGRTRGNQFEKKKKKKRENVIVKFCEMMGIFYAVSV